MINSDCSSVDLVAFFHCATSIFLLHLLITLRFSMEKVALRCADVQEFTVRLEASGGNDEATV